MATPMAMTLVESIHPSYSLQCFFLSDVLERDRGPRLRSFQKRETEEKEQFFEYQYTYD